MSQQKLLEKVVRALEQYGIQYMLTGSVASSLQGEPRSTHDIDIIISIEKPQVNEFAKAFPPSDFYFDEQSIVEAIGNKAMVNLIDLRSGDKVDFWILTDEPFDISRFSRRYIEEFMGLKLHVSSPEDTILAKLRWARLSGGSEKQFTDALRIYEVQFEKLDMDYIMGWIKKLGIEQLWKRLIESVK